MFTSSKTILGKHSLLAKSESFRKHYFDVLYSVFLFLVNTTAER